IFSQGADAHLPGKLRSFRFILKFHLSRHSNLRRIFHCRNALDDLISPAVPEADTNLVSMFFRSSDYILPVRSLVWQGKVQARLSAEL
ncbi:hypothetical protein, partial [Roseburia hominis]|uniref:hypothetical protein n=1 Tax=Roseburia hominis TaxID=301301 RepID=UPI001C0265F1